MVDFANRYETAWKSPVFQHPLSFTHQSHGLNYADLENGKIVILSFPKTGNVWLNALLSDYFAIPGIDPLKHINRSGVGVSHLPFCNRITQRNDFISAVTIVRDPRDVVASYFHYSQTDVVRQSRKEIQCTDIDSFYYEWFLPRVATSLDLNNCAETYARFGVPVVRYEIMRADPCATLTTLINRWGYPLDEKKIQEVVEANTLENLQARGKKLRVEMQTSHFRSGKVGGFSDTLTPKIITDIEVRFARMMGRWGYEPTTDEGKLAYVETASWGPDLVERATLPPVEPIDSWE